MNLAAGPATGRTGRLWWAAGLLLLWLSSAGSEQAGVVWQKGFPSRAGTQVLLLWLPFPGAERYLVVRRDAVTGQEVRWDVAVTQQVDAQAAPDRVYVYTVTALLPGGVPGPVSEPRTLGELKPLEAPRWVGEIQEGNAVRLAWERVERAVFYNLYRSAQGGPPSLLASVQEFKYADAAVTPGATYTYTLRAVGSDNRESRDSEPLRVTAAGAKGTAVVSDEPERRYVEVVQTIRETLQYRLQEPTDLAVWGGQLFVTNQGTRSILVLSREGDFLYSFGSAPPAYPGAWGIPWGIDVERDGTHAAVTFMRSPNVRVFERKGTLSRDFVIGRPPGYEDWPDVPQPMDVAVDEAGDLWVSEYTYGQVVHLNAEGKEVGRIGTPRQAEGGGPFRSPTFLVAEAGRLFVVDSMRGAVFGIDRPKEAMWVWDRSKAREGNLNLPKGIGMDKGGSLLVVDGITSSLQSFRPGGKIEAVYYSRDRAALELTGLVTVAVDRDSGEIFALSKAGSAVHRLKVVTGAKPGRR